MHPFRAIRPAYPRRGRPLETGMSSDTAIIDELMDLVRDRSRRGRRLIIGTITDLHLEEDLRLSDHERALMSTMLAKLTQEIERDVRKELAAGLAGTEGTPADLLLLLGREDMEIARPILERGQVFKDPDLIEIVRRRTDEHRIATALRHGIGGEAVDTLLADRSDDAVETLLRHDDPETARCALHYLLAESNRFDRFQEPLIARSDLPAAFAPRLFWWVAAALRHHILGHYRFDQGRLDEAIEVAAHAALDRGDKRDGAYETALSLALRLREENRLDLPFLVRALRRGRVALFVAGLGVLAGLPLDRTWRVFSDRNGESLTVLMRAIGVERAEFAALSLLLFQARMGGEMPDRSVLKALVPLYDRIDRETAALALNYWRRDTLYQAAIDDLEAR
jgi:uncharacterized protein (DUF2336 family)